MKDRVPTYPGRVQLTPVPGQANTYDMVRADEPTEPGSAINKANLLPDDVAAALGLTGNPQVKDALLALQPQIGDTLTTLRTDLGDDWLLCDGTSFPIAAYPGLVALLPDNPMATNYKRAAGSLQSIKGPIKSFNGKLYLIRQNTLYRYDDTVGTLTSVTSLNSMFVIDTTSLFVVNGFLIVTGRSTSGNVSYMFSSDGQSFSTVRTITTTTTFTGWIDMLHVPGIGYYVAASTVNGPYAYSPLYFSATLDTATSWTGINSDQDGSSHVFPKLITVNGNLAQYTVPLGGSTSINYKFWTGLPTTNKAPSQKNFFSAGFDFNGVRGIHYSEDLKRVVFALTKSWGSTSTWYTYRFALLSIPDSDVFAQINQNREVIIIPDQVYDFSIRSYYEQNRVYIGSGTTLFELDLATGVVQYVEVNTVPQIDYLEKHTSGYFIGTSQAGLMRTESLKHLPLPSEHPSYIKVR